MFGKTTYYCVVRNGRIVSRHNTIAVALRNAVPGDTIYHLWAHAKCDDRMTYSDICDGAFSDGIAARK